jgi:hypothetical protein
MNCRTCSSCRRYQNSDGTRRKSREQQIGTARQHNGDTRSQHAASNVETRSCHGVMDARGRANQYWNDKFETRCFESAFQGYFVAWMDDRLSHRRKALDLGNKPPEFLVIFIRAWR